MADTLPTLGEIERSLSQSIQAFYRNQLGCRTDKVSCHIIEQQVASAIKNPITPVERLLNSCAEDKFVNDLRDRIDNIVKRELLAIVEAVLDVKVVGLTIDTTLDHNFTGIVVLLSDIPNVRNAKNRSSRSRHRLGNFGE